MKSYQLQHIKKRDKWRTARPSYLSGLFTSKYADEFYLHFVCPCCGEQINQLKKLNLKASEVTVDFEETVAGEMMNDLRQQLAVHYKSQCGYGRERRTHTAEILIDKLRDGVYE